MEAYNHEQPSEAEAKAFLSKRLAGRMQELASAVDDAPRRTVVALGILSAPPETQNVHPHVNYRVFQDMEFEHLATDPAFSGLYGVMTYTSGYAEEETIR